MFHKVLGKFGRVTVGLECSFVLIKTCSKISAGLPPYALLQSGHVSLYIPECVFCDFVGSGSPPIPSSLLKCEAVELVS